MKLREAGRISAENKLRVVHEGMHNFVWVVRVNTLWMDFYLFLEWYKYESNKNELGYIFRSTELYTGIIHHFQFCCFAA
jgi:hypothetical protein